MGGVLDDLDCAADMACLTERGSSPLEDMVMFGAGPGAADIDEDVNDCERDDVERIGACD